MFKFPDPKTENPKEKKIQRTLEIIPGVLTWVTLLGMFAFSFFLPVYVSIFIIVFDIYWIFRTIFIAYYSVKGYRKLREGTKIDWWERCQNITDPEKYQNIIAQKISSLRESLRSGKLARKEKIIMKKELARQNKYLSEVEKIKDTFSKKGEQVMDWREVIHVVALPTASEPAEVIEPSIQAVADSNFPNKQFIILLATEEREPEERRLKKVNYLKKKFE